MIDRIINKISPLKRGKKNFLQQHPEHRLSCQTVVRKLHSQYKTPRIVLTMKLSQLSLLVTHDLGLVIPGPTNNLPEDLGQVISSPLHSMFLVQQKYWTHKKFHKQPISQVFLLDNWTVHSRMQNFSNHP